MRRKPIFIRLALLGVTLAVPLLPLTAAPPDPAEAPTAPPGTEEAETPDTSVRVHVVRTERAVDPCDFGRLIALQPACTTPEDCDAWRLWQERMPQGPMAAVPVPRGLPNVMPAGGAVIEPRLESESPQEVLERARRYLEQLRESGREPWGEGAPRREPEPGRLVLNPCLAGR